MTSRKPRYAELIVLTHLLDKELAYFKGNPEKAAELMTVGEYVRNKDLDATEVAAYTVVASMMMNLPESFKINSIEKYFMKETYPSVKM